MIFNPYNNKENIINKLNNIKNKAVLFAEAAHEGNKSFLYATIETDNGIILVDPEFNILNEGNDHNINTQQIDMILNLNYNKRFILITENHTGHGPRMKISLPNKQVKNDKNYYEIFITKEVNHNDLELKKSIDDPINIIDGIDVFWGYKGDNKIIKHNELDLYKYIYVSNLNLMKLTVEYQKYQYPFDIESAINTAFINDSNLRYNENRRVARFINGDRIVYKKNSKNINVTARDIDYKNYKFEDIILNYKGV